MATLRPALVNRSSTNQRYHHRRNVDLHDQPIHNGGILIQHPPPPRRRRSHSPNSSSSSTSAGDHDQVEIVTVHRCSCNHDHHDHDHSEVSEAVRRNHRKLDLVNRSISGKAVFSQVHPKMRSDGSYPKDFCIARTVDDFEAMEMSVIDRILMAYGLLCTFPTVITAAGGDQRGSNREAAREWELLRRKKLSRLYEYLGADQLVADDREQKKMGRERYVTW